MEKPSTPPQNELESIESHLLFLGMGTEESTSNEDRISHKIDAKSISLIKWPKIQNLISDTLYQNNHCYYTLRIYDTGISTETTTMVLNNLRTITETLNSTMDIIKVKQGLFGIFFEILIKTKTTDVSLEKKTKKFNEIKVGAFGDEDSGKSTTLSVIINDKLDDGNGSMRKMNFRFQHEFQTGRTLSITHLFYGLDSNKKKVYLNNLPPNCGDSFRIEKLINLYDMGGCEKAMKNTLSLISPDYIDYALLFVDVKQGITENTKILYVLNNSIHIPIITVITMIDTFDSTNKAELLNNFITKIKSSLSALISNSIPTLIQTKEDAMNYAATSNITEVFPIIPISNTTGEGIELLTFLLSSIPNTLDRQIPLINTSVSKLNSKSEQIPFNFISSPQSQFDIHEHFIVDGQTIIGGVVSKGKIIKGENYYFGPNKTGNFKLLKVKSIHCKKQDVECAYEGQFSSIALSGTNYDGNEVRKGMCLLDTSTTPQSVKSFKADVWSIGPENMKEVKYKCEPVVIINHIRQACKIKKEKKDNDGNLIIDTETNSELTKSTSRLTDIEEIYDDSFRKKRRMKHDKEKEEVFFISKQEKIGLIFEFKNAPEYITEGANVIINDSNFKAFGIVTKVFK